MPEKENTLRDWAAAWLFIPIYFQYRDFINPDTGIYIGMNNSICLAYILQKNHSCVLATVFFLFHYLFWGRKKGNIFLLLKRRLTNDLPPTQNDDNNISIIKTLNNAKKTCTGKPAKRNDIVRYCWSAYWI